MANERFAIQSDEISFWYAAYTRHQHEKSVADMLQKKGFEVFLPLYQTRRRWKDRLKQLSLPLFPSYVFIHGNIERQLQILTTPGVHWLITAAAHVAVIPDVEIAAVKRLVQSSMRLEPHPFLKCGDWVRVNAGPLEDVEGMLVRVKGICRLVISVEMLEKSVAVEVDASNVERVEKRPAKERPCNPPAWSTKQVPAALDDVRPIRFLPSN